VAYFRLGETVGSTTVTDSKAGDTAASTGSSTTLGVTGILASDATATGASFAGTGVFTGSAGLQTALNFERTNAFSIEAWVKPSVGRGSGVQTQVILDHRSSGSSNQGYILFMAWNSGSSQTRIQFQLNNNISGGANSLAMETTSIDMANGTVYHVVFTYDGSSTPAGCKVYVNGVSQTLATDFNTLSASIQTSQVPLIGNVTGGGSLPWQGTLQELAVYNAALTAQQVWTHWGYGQLLPTTWAIDNAASIAFGSSSSNSVTVKTLYPNEIIELGIFTNNAAVTAPTVLTVSGGGLTWAKRSGATNTNTGQNSRMEVWWAYSATPLAPTSVTITLSATAARWVVMSFGVYFANTTVPWDVNISLPADSEVPAGNTPSCTGLSTTNAHDLLLVFDGARNPGVSTQVPTGFTLITSGNDGFIGAGCGYKVVTSVQSNITVTWGTSSTDPSQITVDAMTADLLVSILMTPFLIADAPVPKTTYESVAY
jgi:hypothetical protein